MEVAMSSTPVLPPRPGPRPATTPWAPHVQIDQNAPKKMQAELARRVFALPDVEERPGTVAHPAERAIWLRDDVPVASDDAFLGNREIGHFHPWDGSLHIVLAPELARGYGPLIETHASFPKRTNVQFLKALPGGDIQLEIWERGAGYTFASGSSSCAAAAAAYRLGLCGREVAVHMPGGALAIEIGDEFAMRMTGPVGKVAEGVLSAEVFSAAE
jgi:hypothetical protein